MQAEQFLTPEQGGAPIMPEVLPEVFAQPVAETQPAVAPLPDMARAMEWLEAEGGLEVHRNRSGTDITDCPFLKSLGAAAGKFEEAVRRAVSNPSKGRTMADVMAERRQQKPAKPVETTSAATASVASATARAPFSEHLVTTESKDKVLPRSEAVAVVREAASQTITAEETAPSLAVTHERPPIGAAEQPLLAVMQTARPEVLAQTARNPLQVIILQESTARQTALPEEQPAPAPKRAGQRFRLPLPPISPPIAAETLPAIQAASISEEPAPSKAEVPIEHPVITMNVDPAIEDASLTLPVIEPLSVENSAPTALYNEAHYEVIPTVGPETEQPPLPEETTRQIIALEAVLQEWLATAEPTASFAPHTLEEQQPASPVLPAEESTPDEPMLPVPDQALVLTPETKAQVFETLEQITEVLQSLPAKAAGLQDTFPQLETLCSRLFATLGFKSDTAAIQRIVQDMVVAAQAAGPAELSVDVLNRRGTYEYKVSFAAKLRLYFLQAMHRLRRFVELSRYILARAGGSLLSPTGEPVAA